MFIPCACDRGVDSIVHTPECGSRRFFCIDGNAVVLVGDFVQLPPAAGTTMDSPLQLMAFELKYKQL
jgi:hypothetical protein